MSNLFTKTMETQIFKCYQTNLRTREKKEVEILIQDRLHMVTNDNRVEGDIWMDSGTIKYVFDRVPEHFFNKMEIKLINDTVLSYK